VEAKQLFDCFTFSTAHCVLSSCVPYCRSHRYYVVGGGQRQRGARSHPVTGCRTRRQRYGSAGRRPRLFSYVNHTSTGLVSSSPSRIVSVSAQCIQDVPFNYCKGTDPSHCVAPIAGVVSRTAEWSRGLKTLERNTEMETTTMYRMNGNSGTV
jgi:hypothetical protein